VLPIPPSHPNPKGGLLANLVRSPVFGVCSPEQLEALASSASIRRERRGFQIAGRDAPFPYLGFVCEGVIGVTAQSQGPTRGVRRILLYEALPGSTFGAVAILDRSGALGEISVLSKRATYALIPTRRVLATAQQNQQFLHRLGMTAAARCRGLASTIADQHGWPVSARVARVLMPFASDARGLSPAKSQLDELTQRDIAAAAGCVVEAAARAIAALEEAGALRREHGRIRYLDRDVLLHYFDKT
jgi:signal-transduction protein with cAMP-binding, CBS, and nucleotidyltransferase domain